METNLPDVFAARDCVETYHPILGSTYLPLGRRRTSRAGWRPPWAGDRLFEGSLGTQIVKVFEVAAARTGLRDEDARAAGHGSLTVGSVAFDHFRSQGVLPRAHELSMSITGGPINRPSAARRSSATGKRRSPSGIDIPALALFAEMWGRIWASST
jgi:NADPH-dependent 2,4-dienoyl-CoA reductase/sulfur reductase-like enzyme